MKLKFIYSINSELEIVQEMLEKKDFLLEHGYQMPMPRGYSFESKDLSKLREQIEQEFNERKIEGKKHYITESWDKHHKDIEKFLEDLPYKVPKELIITLSQYGGGSYWVPNRIFYNANYKNLFSGIFHELIHLIIEEPVIIKFNIEHWDKESLVDYFFINNDNLKKVFPEYECEVGSPNKKLLEKVGWS